MSIHVATDIASHKAKSVFLGQADEISKSKLNHKVGQELATTLSEMKGPLMKVGQIFAQLKDVVPPEISEALGQLRQYAKPIEYKIISEQIENQLGHKPDELFAWFDVVPYRAASLGQVHKARLKTGEDVVVKIQYPDVEKDCESDLRHLKNLFRLMPILGVDSKSLDLVFLEIEEVIRRELNYVAEAEAMQSFHDFFKKSDRVVVPVPYREFSTRNVLTMSYVQGESLESLHRIREQARGDPEFIQKVGENLFICLTEQIFNLQKIHVDPHAGNFAVKPDGRIVMYDFGAVKDLTHQTVQIFTQLVEAMFKRDTEELELLLHQKGIRRPNSPRLDEDFYIPWLDILTEPFTVDEYIFEESDTHRRAITLAKTHWKMHKKYFLPSRDTLFLDRLIVGHYWNLVHLKAKLPLNSLLSQYVAMPEQVRLSNISENSTTLK